MKPTQVMKRAIRQITGDVLRIRKLTDEVRHEVEELQRQRCGEERLPRMKELLSEVHTRLEGIEEFVRMCELKTTKKPKNQEEELDLWL